MMSHPEKLVSGVRIIITNHLSGIIVMMMMIVKNRACLYELVRFLIWDRPVLFQVSPFDRKIY